MVIQKTPRKVNFKGLKVTWENLVQFSSASGTNLWGKYQHFGLNLFLKTLRSHNSVYKNLEKN
jgi:hypothetical protein